MPRPSDLRNNTGTGSASSAGPAKNSLNLNAPVVTPNAGQGEQENITARKPDKGHNLHKGGKAQGGAGQSSSRPKV